jgi:hypothetical protein
MKCRCIERCSYSITHHIPRKQIVELAIASLATSTMSRKNYKFVEPQNGPTPCEHTE